MRALEILRTLLAMVDSDRVSMREVTRHLWDHSSNLEHDTDQPVRVRFRATGAMVLVLGPGNNDSEGQVVAQSRDVTREDVARFYFNPLGVDVSTKGSKDVTMAAPGMYGFIVATTLGDTSKWTSDMLNRWSLDRTKASAMRGTKLSRYWTPRMLSTSGRQELANGVRDVVTRLEAVDKGT